MKKLISLLLAIVTVLSLCACTSSGGEEAVAGLQVGYAREKIHPKESVPLGGYGQTEKRMSENTLDFLCATCVAFRDGDNTILMYSQDLIRATGSWIKEVRGLIKEQLGIPEENIMVSATHTHSGPDQSSSHPSITNYKALYLEAMVKATTKAVEDLAPATLSGVKTDADLNYIRHYKMNDGSIAEPNFGDWSSGITGYVRDNDPQMLLVKADREDDKRTTAMG